MEMNMATVFCAIIDLAITEWNKQRKWENEEKQCILFNRIKKKRINNNNLEKLVKQKEVNLDAKFFYAKSLAQNNLKLKFNKEN